MPRASTPSFVAEFPLKAGLAEVSLASSRFEAARQLKNAVLGESLRRLDRMRRDPGFAAAKALPRGPGRRDAFAALRKTHGFREFDLHGHLSLAATSWIRGHLDINTAQKVATRAFRAAERYSFGQSGRPRFARYGEVGSVEGKSNATGIRFRDDRIVWSGAFGTLDLALMAEPGNEVHEHALRIAREGGVKYVRLLLRTVRGKRHLCAQLVLAGESLRKAKHPVGSAEVGLDLGPSQVAIVAEGHVETVPFCPGLDRKEAARRRYLRKLDRQRRAANPDNYNPDGTVKPRTQRKPWVSTGGMDRTRAALAEVLRALAAQRKALQEDLAHKVLALGNRIRVEKCNKRAWAVLWGRSVGHKAPGLFQARVGVLAAASGGFLDEFQTRPTYLSSRCLCGARRKKPLSERRHECGCAFVPHGTWVDRDEFSAFLALHVREGLLDEGRAREAWSSWGVDILLHASSSLKQAASGEAWPRPRGGDPRQSGSQRIGSSVRETTGMTGGERSAEAGVPLGAQAPPGIPVLLGEEDVNMEQKQTTLGPADMVRATQRANFWIRDILALAKNITEDARRTERLAKHKCKACFYRTRMAGQAFTERPCAICGSVEMYPSTHTDTCCLKCAQDRRICKECGGDIDMNPGRRDWSEEGGADQTPIPSHKGQIRE